MRRLRLATVGFALVVLAGCSSPFGMADLSPETSSLSAADRSFISQAAYGSLAEVELGELAQTQASSQQVREFGGRMVTEHTQMNKDLVALASNKGVTPPSAPDPARQADERNPIQLCSSSSWSGSASYRGAPPSHGIGCDCG